MAKQSKFAQWLSKELEEEVTNKRAVYITLCAISFLFLMLAGCAANIPLTIVWLVVFFVLAKKAGMLQP